MCSDIRPVSVIFEKILNIKENAGCGGLTALCPALSYGDLLTHLEVGSDGEFTGLNAQVTDFICSSD